MNKTIKIALLFFAFAFVSADVDAQKFGYINSAALLAEMPEVKQADANLEALQKQLQKQLQQSLEGLQAKYMDLQKKEKRGELSPKQIQVEAQGLKKEEEDLAKREQDMVRQIQTKRESLLQPILDNVNKAIEEVAKADGYTYVFDSSAGILLYADEALDITGKVRTKLGM